MQVYAGSCKEILDLVLAPIGFVDERDYFLSREDRERVTNRLVGQLERPAQTVTLEPITVEAR